MKSGIVGTLIDTLRLPGSEPDNLAARWKNVPTAGLASLVAYEGAAVWLYRRLRATGAIESVPGEFAAELRRQAMEAAGLGMQIEEAAVEVLQLLTRAGLPVVLIKGMARRALARRYPYLDARPTCDVDLLVEESRVREAFSLLRSSGYVEAKPGSAVHHHFPPLWNEHRVAVELHWSTARWTSSATAWKRATEGGQELEWRGLQVRTPSPTELAWNAAYHAVTPSESIVVGFRLQHFLEAAALEAGAAGIDWESLWHRAAREMIAEPESRESLPPHLIRRWMSSARALGSCEPILPWGKGIDLSALLGWRLLVLRSRERLGRAVSDRFMEEGPRTLIGAPIESSHNVIWPKRLRRRTATVGSRVIFRTWRLVRKRQ